MGAGFEGKVGGMGDWSDGVLEEWKKTNVVLFSA